MARLTSLRAALPYVSQAALSAVLKEVAAEPTPPASRRDLRQARDEVVQRETAYGRLHQSCVLPGKAGGTPVDLEIQAPAAMLCHVAAKSSDFSGLLRRTLAERPSTPEQPWHVLLYLDEILPGNQLAYKHPRKL